jgi:hypothetical protein
VSGARGRRVPVQGEVGVESFSSFPSFLVLPPFASWGSNTFVAYRAAFVRTRHYRSGGPCRYSPVIDWKLTPCSFTISDARLTVA